MGDDNDAHDTIAVIGRIEKQQFSKEQSDFGTDIIMSAFGFLIVQDILL